MRPNRARVPPPPQAAGAHATTSSVPPSAGAPAVPTAPHVPEPTAPSADAIARGLLPVAAPDARVLVLGSMLGAESLRQRQYYAHPRNHFWPIAGALFGAGPELPYATRLQRLVDAGIALWDVLAECVRPGSLDASIDPATARVNDFAGFFAAHPRIRAVFCNGTYSASTFERRVIRAGLLPTGIPMTRLPSTSPANASWTLERKLDAWRAVADALGRERAR